MKALGEGKLVTFGIQPTHAHTGYGYLELAQKPDVTMTAIDLKSFVEKPDAARAETLFSAGTFMWNTGIFLFKAKDIISAFEENTPSLVAPVSRSVDGAEEDLGFLRLDPVAWQEVEDISIDYAVMERANNLAVVPFDGGWSDLGGWDAVWEESPSDADGVA